MQLETPATRRRAGRSPRPSAGPAGPPRPSASRAAGSRRIPTRCGCAWRSRSRCSTSAARTRRAKSSSGRWARREELPAELSEQELADAFEHAEPEAEHLLDADRVAQQALREAELGPADEISPPQAADSLFATRTMAELLERQGDRAGAERIRDRLERARGDSQGASASDRRGRLVRELERWLANLRTEA